ncbi:MAG: hypothetical protein ACLPKI_14700 [Streptosporangiaceae bacterium]
MVRYPWPRFAAATLCAGVIWASYAFFPGRLGGKTFEDRPWLGFLLAFGVALAVSAVLELVCRARPGRVLRWLHQSR